MDPHFWNALVASLIAATVTAAGIAVVYRFDRWCTERTAYFSCFAAGVLIAVSFLHIVPESLEMNHDAAFYLLGGYFFMFIFNRFVSSYVCNTHGHAHYALGLIPALGIGFHSFIDGIIYSITFTASTFTGALASVGMIFHEFPEGVVTYMLLIKGGFSRGPAAAVAFLVAGLSTPIGMLVSYPFVSPVTYPTLGLLMGISAGTLIYVGATHLLPEAEREPKKYSLIALGAGICVAAISTIAGH
ncbi:MAG: ZIP family metal transporter [Alphaproteobacteria bacterium]|nr:ZIP family metal transporter [Alphaproteobacteria bacterium]